MASLPGFIIFDRVVVRTLAILALSPFWLCAETFRVVTFNVENYLNEPTQTRAAKSADAKAQVRLSILALKPDILALQEIGGQPALEELQGSLRAEGLDLPHSELVYGADTNVQVAILSKFSFAARRPRTNDNFLLGGRRHRVSRGFGEVEIRANTDYVFTLITAHLKSKRPVPQADEADLRLEEAKLLREEVDARLSANPNENLIVLGDFNDTKDSLVVRAVIGRGRHKLVDTRPAELEGDSTLGPASEHRAITWTHYFAREDTYSRIDYILVSPGMAREWLKKGTYILSSANWSLASDHRPLVATFEATDR